MLLDFKPKKMVIPFSDAEVETAENIRILLHLVQGTLPLHYFEKDAIKILNALPFLFKYDCTQPRQSLSSSTFATYGSGNVSSYAAFVLGASLDNVTLCKFILQKVGTLAFGGNSKGYTLEDGIIFHPTDFMGPELFCLILWTYQYGLNRAISAALSVYHTSVKPAEVFVEAVAKAKVRLVLHTVLTVRPPTGSRYNIKPSLMIPPHRHKQLPFQQLSSILSPQRVNSPSPL
jgi:hypothetical protein